MENEKKIYTEEELKKQTYDEIVADVINEIDNREDNIKIYYPYFIIRKKLKTESENIGFDLNGIFIALLSFLLYVGKLNNKKITYQDICEYIEYFIQINYQKNLKEQEVKKIVNLILDIAQNNGKNFIFSYYSLKSKNWKEKYLNYIEIKPDENRNLNYYITTQGIDFYLKTKEFPEATQITINLLLFRKQIEKGSFNYAYDTVRRLNIEVKRKIEQKDSVLEGLMYGGKEGINNYIKYHESVREQFTEEEELFSEISRLVKDIYTEYLSKEGTKNLNEKEQKTIELIRKIEKELNKALNNHTTLLKEAIEMTKKHDEIIDMITKSAFSEKFKFEQEFEKVITKTDNPEKLLYFITPFLQPKKIKSFNPMKSLENQKIYTETIEEKVVQEEQIHNIETVDSVTQKRVVQNFKFYFEVLITILKNKNKTTLQEFSNYLKKTYEEKSLYNADFIAFVLYLNNKKIIKTEEDEIFKEFSFKPIKIIPQKEDIELGNGLKVTNIIFERS